MNLPAYQFVTAAAAVMSTLGVFTTGCILIFRQGRFFGKLTEHEASQDVKIASNCSANTSLAVQFHNFRSEFERARYLTEQQHGEWCERNAKRVFDKMGNIKSDTEKDIDEIKQLLATGEKRRDESRKEDDQYKRDVFGLLGQIKTSVDVIAANHSNLAERVSRLEGK